MLFKCQRALTVNVWSFVLHAYVFKVVGVSGVLNSIALSRPFALYAEPLLPHPFHNQSYRVRAAHPVVTMHFHFT